MPEEAWRFLQGDPRSHMESGLFRDTASPEAEDLAMPARNKAVHARDSPIKRAKQAASPQQRGTASRNEGQGLYKGQKVRRGRDIDAPIVKRLEDAPTLEQLKKLSFDQIVAVGEQLLVIGREVTSEARKFRRRCRKSCAEMSRREDRVLYADLAARRIQGLREEGRQQALAHVGIHSCAYAPDGKPWRDRIITLVKDWAITWETELTLPQKTAITDHFGSQFISFVNTNILVTDLAEEHELTYPYSLDMPWVERSFVMDAIDDLRPKALRDGGRIVYMAFFGCTSWNAEKRRLFNKIASRRAHDSNPEH